MKKFLLVFLLIAMLAGGGVFFAIKKYVNTAEIEARVVAAVKEKTGRDLAFSRMRVMPFITPLPALMVKLENVTFSNAEWAGAKPMTELGALEVRLALRPLLEKRIEILKFTLDKPIIRLQVAADGKKNWEFPAQKKDGAQKPAAQGDAKAPDYAKDLTFKFSQVEIVKGAISYLDAKTGTNLALEKVDLNINYPDLDSGVQLDGWAEYRGQRVSMFLNLDKPLELAKGAGSSGKLTLKSDGVFTATAVGKLATAGTFLKGKLDADITSLSKLSAWLSGGEQQDMPFTQVKFSSAAELSAAALKLSGAKLALDEVAAEGDVALALAGAKPAFTARARLNKLDLDRFTGAAKDEPGNTNGDAKAQPAAKQQDWDATPLDFSGLKAVNADLVLSTAGFSLRGADVGPSTLTVQLRDGNLRFKSTEATLFGGRFLSDISVSAAQKTPTATIRFGMTDVEAKPVLTTFADFDKLSGKMDAVVDVTTAGNSEKALIGNLTGNGSFNFKNGSLKGIDLVSIMSSVQKRLGEMGVGQGKTDFVDMGGTFTVANGVARNDDLKMRGPLVQATGSGTLDLPRKYINYRALPVLTASSAMEGAKGLTVPVDIKGPFSNIKVKPDYAGAITKILENPDDIKAAVKHVRENSKDIIKGFKEDPDAAIGNLLGGGLFGRKKKTDAEEQPPVEDPNAIAPYTAP
ncbi:MAG TPA: AsmA family protein [Patescibacteria group bacterium]|nr:AsmA family protein [Patescibacteria group bacterium]